MIPSEYKSLDNAVKLYEETLTEIFNSLAPQKTKFIVNNKSDWWNSECRRQRRSKRKAERIYRQTKNQNDLHHYRKATRYYVSKINKIRDNYYNKKFNANTNNSKLLYRTVKKVLKKMEEPKYPSGINDKSIANNLSKFFNDKVEKIHADIKSENELYNLTNKRLPVCNNYMKKQCSLTSFKSLSKNEIAEIIKSMNHTTCILDPIPTNILIECLDELITIISYIVNESLIKGLVTENLKLSVTIPGLKKMGLDHEQNSNYRPISNLKFLAKIIEKCVSLQLNAYLENNDLHAFNQSGYRKWHSCETALTKIHDDILIVSDKDTNVVMLLLDLSAAFDTIDHAKLLHKLKNNFGISQTAHKWFESYLSNRHCQTKVNNELSEWLLVKLGVPQGSILGPILFIMYTKELESIASDYGLQLHLYADDNQLYSKFKSNSVFNTLANVSNCMVSIKLWMNNHFLKLNQSKTEILFIQSNYSRNYSHEDIIKEPILIDSTNVTPSTSAKILGVYFDHRMSMTKHVNETCKSCYIHLRNIRQLGSRLSTKVKLILVQSLVLSRLDYCNNLLYRCSQFFIKKLQKVQNCAVRLIFNLRRRTSTSRYLKRLHFLPVKFRIIYKITLLVFKCLNNMAPKYLKEKLTLRSGIHTYLRKDDDFYLLNIPNINSNQLSHKCKAFSYCGPTLWNDLPFHIRCVTSLKEFKSKLKTHYFTIAFENV